jgi:hypothetical protein
MMALSVGLPGFDLPSFASEKGYPDTSKPQNLFRQ